MSINPAQDVTQARSDGKVHLLLAASGSVATIKIPNIIKGLSRHPNLSIRLVLTSFAAEFLQGQAEEQPSLTDIRNYPNVDAIYTDESEWVQPWTRGAPILHIELRKCKSPNNFSPLIAPLSANTLAKMVHGISDSLLSSTILAWDTDGFVDGKKKKILVATAMNTAMFRNPITQRNLKLLNELMGGADGWVEELQTISKGLACGDVGQGAMATVETIVAAIEEKLGLAAKEIMAHPNRSSLLSRLFPQEQHLINQFSSGEDLSSSSTLFAHLSSPGLFSVSKAPYSSSSSREEQFRPNDLFRACFANFSNDTAKSKPHEEKAAKGDALEQLREAFAQEGVELYTSVASKLAEAQQEMASQISDFATMSSSIAADMDELYANLSYPLSTTLCHSKNFPRATIEVHLANVKEDLRTAESELQGLEREWQDNVQLEQKLRQELLDMEGNPAQTRERGHHSEDDLKKTGFRQEIEQIVAEAAQALEEIDERYREGIQALTVKMMQAMRAD
ncbi:hypothetical protein N5P37_005515 [Trichoderma harzianum]|nr:hypothetical protein N5P37_005515 [Trichoderma harzianum]